MKTKTLAALVTGMLGASSALAIPTLQLDINGGTYVGGTEESTVTTGSTFDLWALGLTTVDGKNSAVDPSLDYYLSIALLPKTSYSGEGSDPANLGAVLVNGNSLFDSFSSPQFGTPPIESVEKSDANLAPHGVFETYYYQLAFNFDTDSTTAAYNVQDGSTQDGKSLYKKIFSIDASELADGYGIHFDLFTFESDDGITIGKFAPFSHDAAYCVDGDCGPVKVPEPSTLALFSIGLMGLVAIRRRARIK